MKDDLKASVGRKIRKIRKSLGFTQEKMVSYFNIGRANYSRIEKGEVSPGLTLLETLSVKFNVSLDWLISNDGTMFIRDKSKKKHKELAICKNQDIGQCSNEVAELLNYFEKVPVVKHAVLCFFLEYKIRHQDMINEYLKSNEPSNDKIAEDTKSA